MKFLQSIFASIHAAKINHKYCNNYSLNGMQTDCQPNELLVEFCVSPSCAYGLKCCTTHIDNQELNLEDTMNSHIFAKGHDTGEAGFCKNSHTVPVGYCNSPNNHNCRSNKPHAIGSSVHF